MDQQSLWHDSPEEALRSLVDALGGPKRVGAELMGPGKRLEEARRLVLHWCDESRPEKPGMGELLWLLARGRQEGCHTFAAFLMREAGYADPMPVEPEDERARLMREYVRATRSLEAISRRMDRAVSMPLKGGG